MADYTPETDEVRDLYEMGARHPSLPPVDIGSVLAMWDRWLAAHDAQVTAKALEDAQSEKLEAEWVAFQAVKHRSEGDNRYRVLKEERDALLAVLNERDDAALWHRITHQRFELARLNRAQFQHAAEIRQLSQWFRERIAADGGQARKELANLRAEMATPPTPGSPEETDHAN